MVAIETKLRSHDQIKQYLQHAQKRNIAEAAIQYLINGIEPSNKSHTTTRTWLSVKELYEQLSKESNSVYAWDRIGYFIVGVVLLAVAVYFGTWTFTEKKLTKDQRLVLLWILPLASGFACGSFTGAIAARSPEGRLGAKIFVSATGGFAVWLLSHWLLPSPEYVDDIVIELVNSGKLLNRQFEVNIVIPPYPEVNAQGKGSVTVALPTGIKTITRLKITCTGYKQRRSESFDITDGSVKVDMVQDIIDPLEFVPCPPEDALEEIRTKVKDTNKDIESIVLNGSRHYPEEVVFHYRNHTTKHFRLLLFDSWKHYQYERWKREGGPIVPNSPWVEWDFPPSLEYQVDQYVPPTKKSKRSGWFGFYVMEIHLNKCHFLGSFDVYNSLEPKLDVYARTETDGRVIFYSQFTENPTKENNND